MNRVEYNKKEILLRDDTQ